MAAEDSYVDLFGDFKSDDEDASPSASAAPSQKRGAAASSSSAAPANTAPPAKRKKLRKDIADFYELEAEEGAASGDEEEPDIEGLIDYGAAMPGEEGIGQIRRQQEQKRRELEQLGKEIAAREAAGRAGQEVVGARRVFGSAFLDKLEGHFRQLEEEEGMSLPGDDDFDLFSIPDRKREEEEAVDEGARVVPTERDPKLWLLPVRAPEKEIIMKLTSKAGAMREQGLEPPIYSVFSAPNIRGYIYIEAHKESDVRSFCQGIYGVMTYSIKIVPVAQMNLVYTAAAAAAEKHGFIQVHDWVRLKRGKFKHDLAQVMGIDEEEYFLRLKPRLDIAGTLLGGSKDGKKQSSIAMRPPQRWFNMQDLDGHAIVTEDAFMTPLGAMTFFVLDDQKYRDGYCWISVRNSFFEHGPEKVRPSEHELQDWSMPPPIDENTRPGYEADKEAMPPPPTPAARPPPPASVAEDSDSLQLAVHDIVIVNEGEMKNLRGRVTRAVKGEASVRVELFLPGEEKQTLGFQESMLNKYFEVGDRVQVLEGGGEHTYDTGTIVRVNLQTDGPTKYGRGASAAIVNEAIIDEFVIPLHLLRRTDETVRSEDQVGEFACGMMVRVDDADIGVLTKIELDSRAVVLTINNERKRVAFTQLKPMPTPSNGAMAADRKGTRFNVGSMVKAPRSLQKTLPINAKVIYIYGIHVFLKAVDYLVGDKAYLVCRAKTVELSSLGRLPPKQTDLVKMALEDDPSLSRGQTKGVKMASELDWRPDWFKKQMDQHNKDKNKDTSSQFREQGFSVEVRGGKYKGLRGEVRADLGEKVRISLLAENKLIEVPKCYVTKDEIKSLVKQEEEVPASPPKGEARARADADTEAASEQADDDDEAWNPLA